EPLRPHFPKSRSSLPPVRQELPRMCHKSCRAFPLDSSHSAFPADPGGVSVVCFKLGLLAFVEVVSAAPLCSSHAAIISISDPKLSQCGHGGVVCNGTLAFSLTELEMGAVQLPIQ